jgi:hypothetical protein
MLSHAAPPERIRGVALLGHANTVSKQARLGDMRRLNGDDLIDGVACKILSDQVAFGGPTLGRATHHDVGDLAY